MKSYFADANIFLRFILKDNKNLALKAQSYFSQAKKGKLKIIFIPEIILEIEYVLRKVYQEPRSKIAKNLSILIKSPYIEIYKRQVFLRALSLYESLKIDLVDFVLFFTAQDSNGQILSFDKDFKKIQKAAILPS